MEAAMRAARDFSRKILNALAKRGVSVIGSQAAPAYEGDFSLSGRVYQISSEGCSMMRTHAQVMEMAQ
jgi:hypothetical protein